MEPVVFFGTGPVAARSLKLLAEWTTIEVVITKPKPAHHKGSFPVLEMAAELNLPIIPVTTQASLDEAIAQTNLKSRLGILIDFGIIVSQAVIDYFPLGIINSHFSILPEWRGADPISFAILSGQETTGVSLMVVDAGLDTGKVLVTKSLKIKPTDTTPSLTDRLIILSDELLLKYLPEYINGKLQPRQQSHPDRATYSRKIEKADGALDFKQAAAVLEREIRAFSDWPKSRTTLAGKDVIITAAHAVPSTTTEAPGYIEVLRSEGIIMINTTDGYLFIDRLKPAGKAEMTAKAFLAGYGSGL